MNSTIVRPVPGSVPRNGLPAWRPYVYRGVGTDILTPHLGDAWDDVPARAPRDPSAEPCWCGEDMSGYRKHLADSNEPCQASRDEVNAYHRERARVKRENRRGTCGYLRSSQNHRIVCGGAR